MSNRNETPTLLLSLLVTVILLGGLGIWGWQFLQKSLGTGNTGTSASNPSQSSPGETASVPNTANGNQATAANPSASRLSTGEQSLIAENVSTLKQLGVDAIAAGNSEQAVDLLEAAIREDRNDPEALIYLNNAQIGDAEAYTIAIAAPIASALNPALEILRGVAQAQTEINEAGGMDGVLLRVVIADDGETAETATQLAQQFVEREDVLAVVGHFSSGTTIETAPIYTEGELLLISPTSTSVQISGMSDYVFRTAPSDRFAATSLARYMLEDLQEQTVGIFFNSESSYSTSLKDEFTTAVFSDGGQVLAEFDLMDASFDAEQAITQL
ncbi:MAG: ABC transporter substrate-binding protein, partial [Cyanobacteria bacterium J06626_18]